MSERRTPYRTRPAQNGAEMPTSGTVTDLVAFVRTERKWLNAKRKGTRNEARSMAILEDAGYWCMRAAGSHGVFDFVAVSSLDTVWVQVKSSSWPGKIEMEAIKLCPVPPNSRKLVHRWRLRQQHPDVREVP